MGGRRDLMVAAAGFNQWLEVIPVSSSCALNAAEKSDILVDVIMPTLSKWTYNEDTGR